MKKLFLSSFNLVAKSLKNRNYGNEVTNGGNIQIIKKETVLFKTSKCLVTPPEAPPYPTTPEDDRQDDEGIDNCIC